MRSRHEPPGAPGRDPEAYAGGGYPGGPSRRSALFGRADGEVGLPEILTVLYDQRRVAGVIFLVVLLATGLFLLTRPPVYQATVTIQIDRDDPYILSFKDVTPDKPGWGAYDEYTQTQFQILKSQALAARVIRRLDLEGSPEFQAGSKRPALASAKARVLSWIRSVLPGRSRAEELDPAEESSLHGVPGRLIDAFLSRIKVSPVHKTRLVKLSYASADPKRAALIADGIAEAYKAYILERKLDLSSEARDFLTRQLHDLEQRVRDSEAALDRFRQANQILSLDDKENTSLHRLQQLNELLTKAQADRIAKEASYNLIEGGAPDSLPAILASDLVAQLKRRLADLEQERGRLSEKFLPDYPQMRQIEVQTVEAGASLDREMRRIARGVEQEYRAARETEESLRSQVAAAEKEALDKKSVSVEYALLKREVDANRQLYDGLLQRMKETTVAAGLKTGNVRIIDPARVPTARSYPRRLRILVTGIVLALVLGVGAACLREFMTDVVSTPELAHQVLGLPSLALLPAVSEPWWGPAARRRAVARATGRGRSGPDGDSQPEGRARVELAMLARRATPLSEAYRTLITGLIIPPNGNPLPKSILVTSSLAGEGKTSAAINASLALAQGGRKVVLLDADLRRPWIHKVLDLPNARGLSTVLRGEADLDSVSTGVFHENLRVIPAGAVPEDPYSLIASGGIARVLEDLSEKSDYVVFDSSPVLPVADALLVASLVDGVLLLVDASRTPVRAVEEAHRRLVQAKAKLLGVLLNKVEIARSYRYRYASGYYSYYPG